MILLNFSHPITHDQHMQIEAITGHTVTQMISVPPQFDEQRPFRSQVADLFLQVDLRPEQWQGEPILVILPSLNFIAALLLAELHGRMGYFPPIVRTRPIAGAVPRQYEIAEVLDLQSVREMARKQRG